MPFYEIPGRTGTKPSWAVLQEQQDAAKLRRAEPGPLPVNYPGAAAVQRAAIQHALRRAVYDGPCFVYRAQLPTHHPDVPTFYVRTEAEGVPNAPQVQLIYQTIEPCCPNQAASS